ncbi:ANKRD17, partial [Symbiodinium sp. KB8]
VAQDRGLDLASGQFQGVETAAAVITEKDLQHCPMARLMLQALEILWGKKSYPHDPLAMLSE